MMICVGQTAFQLVQPLSSSVKKFSKMMCSVIKKWQSYKNVGGYDFGLQSFQQQLGIIFKFAPDLFYSSLSQYIIFFLKETN